MGFGQKNPYFVDVGKKNPIFCIDKRVFIMYNEDNFIILNE